MEKEPGEMVRPRYLNLSEACDNDAISRSRAKSGETCECDKAKTLTLVPRHDAAARGHLLHPCIALAGFDGMLRFQSRKYMLVESGDRARKYAPRT